MQSQKLIQSLSEQVKSISSRVEELQRRHTNILLWRESATSWNIIECLEHLNLYGDHYLPLMEKKINASKTKQEVEFTSGRLGGYFAKSMLPGKKMKKMKTFRDKNPLNAGLDATVIARFLAQQDRLLELLNRSRHVSLNKIRIPTSISPAIRLKLGDTFQFYINHVVRHMAQIHRIEAGAKAALPAQKQQDKKVLNA